MKKLILAMCLLLNMPIFADSHDDLVHFSAHFGMGYVVGNVSYGIYNQGLGLNKFDSLMLSLVTSIAANLAYKAVEHGTDVGSSTFATGLGGATAVGTAIVFGF